MKGWFDDIQTPLLILALVVQSLLLLRLDWTTSPNRTELGHIAAALRFYETGSADLFHVNPPLLRMLVGPAIALSVKPQTDWTDYSTDPTKRSEWATGVAFIRANDCETVRHSFFIGRAVCIPLILLGGFFGYRFSCELFGGAAGFVFLALWTFSPLILGWGTTICPDVTAASLGIVALYIFWHWLKAPTWKLTVLSGLTLGLLPLTKLTWIVAFGFWFVIWLLVVIPTFIFNCRESFRQFRQMAFLLTLALFVLNLGYCFDGSFKKLGDYSFHSASLTNDVSGNRFSESWFGTIPMPFPEQFILGFDTQRIDFEKGMPSYLFGVHAGHGWWYYYVVALAVKEPIGTLLLIVMAVFLVFFVRFRSTWRDEIVLLVPLFGLLIAVSSQTGFSLHSRYIIPALPILYTWSSRTGRLIHSNNLAIRTIVPICLIASAASSLWVYPYSMSYLNEMTRERIPPPLLGSNIDWGQDMYELKNWLEDHPESRPIRVAMSNIYPLETLGIKSAGLPPRWKPGQETVGTWREQIRVGPRPGWFLLGANDMFSAGHEYEWLWSVPPIKRIGWSTYIFHVMLEEANRLREQDDLPVLTDDDFE
jgi:hypothetical protein